MANQSYSTESRQLESDSLWASICFLLGLTLVQRVIGLGRNILFCGWLAADELGRWSLAFNFLLLAAPLAVLGVPGSFGRYVEHYRQRGQLRSFLWRTAGPTAAVALLVAGLLVIAPNWFGWLLFGDANQVALVRVLAVVLLGVIAFNVMMELLTALRLVRFASLMQLACSTAFLVVGILLIRITRQAETAVVLAYGISAILAAALGMAVVIRFCGGLPEERRSLPQVELWSKLAPFAFWIWAGNLVTNLFEVSDQFMLKHFAGLNATAADSLIGQYYSSRVIPLLLISAACMFASSLVPHLTRDWDAGQHETVRRRMHWVLKGGSLILTLAAALVLAVAPLLFSLAFGGKYDTGLAILPVTLMYCVWYCLGCLANSYLLCAERAKWSSLALLIGFLLNLALNYCWAPQFGLPGVIAATATANAVGLSLILALSRCAGMVWDRGVWLASWLPLSLLLGGWAAAAITTVVCAVTLCRPWILCRREAAELRLLARGILQGRKPVP